MRRLLLAALLAAAAPPVDADPAIEARVARVLDRAPLIDGHNDLAWALRENYGADWPDLTRSTAPKLHTDIPRLRAGHVGGQFWSVWVPVSYQGDAAVTATLEQIDAVKRLAAAYPRDLELATTAADVRRIARAGRVASLIGVEGGHQIANSLSVLRDYYRLGVRYMTLTHTTNTDWADSATDTPAHGGLTPFGEAVVREMNRIGMLVDLAHVAPATIDDALAVARAPVILSHEGARALVDHPRNVGDAQLKKVAANGGVVMVDFVTGYVSAAAAKWDADEAAEKARTNAPPYGGMYIGQPERAKAALDAWRAAHPRPVVRVGDVADHVEHVASVAGHDHVGIGVDFDGITQTVEGLSDVSMYPALFAELARRGWSDANLAKLAGGNVLRVMERTEAVARSLSGEPPSTATIAIDAPAK